MHTRLLNAIIVSTIIISSSMSVAGTSSLKMVGFEYAPISIVRENGELDGMGPEIVRAMAKILERDITVIIASTARSVQLLDDEPIILPVLSRTIKREKKYHWIGPIHEDVNCFVTLIGRPQISTIDQAKTLNSVGVNAGGRTYNVLTSQEFQNLAPMSNNSANAKKLFAGRIDAWFSTKLIATNAIRKQKKLDVKQVSCLPIGKEFVYYIAASKKIKAQEIKMLKEAYAQLVREGHIKKIRAKYN